MTMTTRKEIIEKIEKILLRTTSLSDGLGTHPEKRIAVDLFSLFLSLVAEVTPERRDYVGDMFFNSQENVDGFNEAVAQLNANVEKIREGK